MNKTALFQPRIGSPITLTWARGKELATDLGLQPVILISNNAATVCFCCPEDLKMYFYIAESVDDPAKVFSNEIDAGIALTENGIAHWEVINVSAVAREWSELLGKLGTAKLN